MTQDFVTQLRLQLREAALREERRAPLARRVVRARRGLPGPGPLAAALAVALLALAVALGALALRGDREPAALRVLGSSRVAPGLASLAPGFGSVWAADPIREQVLRIDPASRRVVARIPVGGEARVAVGGGAVWAIAGDLLYGGDNGPVRLLRIDPRTNRAAVARVPLRTPNGDRFAPLELQVDRGGSVWAIGMEGALRIAPRGRYVPLAGSAGPPRGVVADGGSIWALTASGRLRLYDADTGRAAGTVRVPPALRLLGGPPGLLTLLTAKNGIALIERATGRTVWETQLGDDIGRLLFDGGALWVQYATGPDEGGRLARLDVDGGRRLGDVALPDSGVAGMAKVGRDLWVATPGGTIIVVR